MRREFVHIIIYIAAISVWLAGWQADAQTFTIRSVIAEREAQAGPLAGPSVRTGLQSDV